MDLPQGAESKSEALAGDIWCCPRCKGEFGHGAEAVDCRACGRRYPVIGGVPDLRIDALCPFDLAEDRRRVAAFLKDIDGLDAAASVRQVFARRPGWSNELIDLRTKQVLRAPEQLAAEIGGWLREIVFQDLPFLDLGCGPGMLLAAAARQGRSGFGVDLSLEWLVVAHRLIAADGGSPALAAGSGEALPLRDGSIGGVAGLDVIEHVSDVGQVLADVDRVLRPGGALVLTTPNRFSLTPEPHVFVWGVGWLPRRLQAPYVKWRSGRPYTDTRLMSSWRLVKMVRDHTSLEPRIVIPPVRPADARGSRLRGLLIALYNRLIKLRLLQPFFLLCGPFFRLWGHKPQGVD